MVLACGGLSYQATGSTGDGMRMAQELGHSLVPLHALTGSLPYKEEWCRQLQGLALKNVSAALYIEEKEIYSGFGEMLFTHFGVSGPLILSASSYYQTAAEKLEKEEGKAGKESRGGCRAFGKWKDEGTCLPEAGFEARPSMEQLDKRILRDFEDNKNKQFKNAVDGLFPPGWFPSWFSFPALTRKRRVHEITREERKIFWRMHQGTDADHCRNERLWRGDNHPRRRPRKGGQPLYHGIQAGARAVYGRWNAGSGCADRRL